MRRIYRNGVPLRPRDLPGVARGAVVSLEIEPSFELEARAWSISLVAFGGQAVRIY